MKKQLLVGFALACAFASAAYAKQRHMFITGPFKTGQDVTKTCLECHQQETKALMKTVHWNWTRKQTLNGKSIEYGKRNALNNYGGALASNWAGCTNCHAGYGWKDDSFDFTKMENIDCLVCHETTGTYKKAPGGAGEPLYTLAPKPDSKDKTPEPLDLVEVARSVDRPTRAACGACHFYGEGGDNAKHGDLDSSLADPTPEIDVHMGRKKMTCESCHKAPNHDVKGQAVSVSLSSGLRTMACLDCHKVTVHKKPILNWHIKRVACQTCHIPFYAKVNPTLTWWNWSSAGKDVKVEKDSNGKDLYNSAMGDLRWGKNLVPTYFWYNGAIDRVMMGDKIDPTKVVQLTAPKGERSDPNARIFPFKIMRGKQPYDKENLTLAVVNSYGPANSPTAFSARHDWNKAIDAGMKAAGQPYSGKYGWVETSMAWSLNHMVAPKEQALSCPNCHVANGRLNWTSLGYPKDPRGTPGN